MFASGAGCCAASSARAFNEVVDEDEWEQRLNALSDGEAPLVAVRFSSFSRKPVALSLGGG